LPPEIRKTQGGPATSHGVTRLTITSSRTRANCFFPSTFRVTRSSSFRYGRFLTIRSAISGVMPGRRRSSSTPA